MARSSVGLRFARSKAAQRGNLIVTAFVIVMGMMLVFGGINTFLQQQIATSTTMEGIGYAKLQTLYLAEMGLNQVMYTANQAANVGQPNPFPVGTATGSAASFDFTQQVAMVRGGAANAAHCVVVRTGALSFQVDAYLNVPKVGNFTKSITFSAAQSGSAWVLASYNVL